MPILPTGGLSIFINLTILILGFIFKHIKRIAFVSSIILFIQLIVVDKKYDHFYRRSFGYSVAISIFLIVFTTTSYSVYNRLTHESNFDYISNVVNEIKITWLDDSPEETLPTASEQNETPIINPDYIAKDNYLLALLSKVHLNK